MNKQADKNKKLPFTIRNSVNWELNRKQFLKSILLGSAVTQIPFAELLGQVTPNNEILSSGQVEILQSVQEILFPSDENGPGIIEINATEYLVWILSDKNKDPEEIEYIINGIGWVNETAEENYQKKYLDLSQLEREQLIAFISKESWGESWLSVILSFIFEALLCDPQYGGNLNNVGSKWLDHQPGQPRPTAELLYPEILTTIHKS